jgi:Tfp pilus assembly protein PilE
VSKRQEKIEKARAEQHAFLLARRQYQLAYLEQMYAVGNKLFEDNKDKLSEEELAQITKMRDEQLDALEKVKAEISSYEIDTQPQA